MSAVLKALEPGKRRVSFEVVPPSRGASPEAVLGAVESLLLWDPAFVSVTDHPSGRYWREQDGKPVAMPARAKPGTFGLCVALRDRLGVTTVPHVVCVGNDRFRAEDELIDIAFAGFTDVFLVRGDQRFSPYADKMGPGELASALELVRLHAQVREGRYSGREKPGMRSGLSAGVAAYPEKHPASPNREADLTQLAGKVAAGAQWAITQMLFDATLYKDYIEQARAAGIGIPIIPGVKVLTGRRSLEAVPGAFNVSIPIAFQRAMDEARSPEEERLAGLRHAEALVRSLYDFGAPCVHFFTMGKADDVLQTLSALFGSTPGGER